MSKRPVVRPKSPEMGGGSSGTPTPAFNHASMLLDLGSTGLRAFGGYVREDYIPNLTGRQGATIYREMLDSSPIVGAVMFAIQGIMRKVEWRVDPVDESPAAAQAAEFVDSLRFDMSHSWEDFVSEALSMLGYGFSLHEIVYKRRLGPMPFGKKKAASKYNDGMIGWRRLPTRSQDTLLKWFFDENGEALGFTQQPWIGPLTDIPLEKCLLFRPSAHKNNPEGRPLPLDVRVPTPDGWTTMGAIVAGDRVYDEMGAIRRVVGKSEIFRDRPIYEIEFSTGATIRADACHLWRVSDTNDRTRGKTRDVTTEQIAAWFDADGKAHKQLGASSDRWVNRKAKNVSCGVAPVLESEDAALPLDPYVIGYWLGNGKSDAAQLTCHAEDAEEIAAIVGAAGFCTDIKNEWRENGATRHLTFYGSQKWASDGPSTALRFLGVINNKHVPAVYMAASPDQRLALLQGLMDSDGWSPPPSAKDRASTFANTNKRIIDAVVQIVRSLGGQPRVRVIDVAGEVGGVVNGHSIVSRQTCYEVRFILELPVHRLARKAERQFKKKSHRTAAHFIKAIRRVENADTVCIEVDSPSHLFLAGESMVPTHNSILRNAYRPYYFVKRLEEGEAIMIERMSGNVIVRVPTALMDKAAAGDAAAIATLTAYKQMATRARTDEQMGLLLPSDTYQTATGPSAIRMFDYEYVTPQGGAKNLEPNTPITRHKLDILSSVLCDFIQMGHTNRGAQNLADTKVDLFMQAVEGWLNAVGAVLNQQGVSRIWELNGLDPALKPEIIPDMAQQINLDMLGNFILALSQSGAQLFPDEDLETYIRDVAGLPDAMDGNGWKSMQEEDQNDAKGGKKPGKEKTAKAIAIEVAKAMIQKRRR